MYGAYDVRVEKANETPPLLAEHVLLDVEAVGICGSDLHYYKDGGIGSAKIDPQHPFVPGHEFSARLREGCDELALEAGTRVAVDPALACGQCEWCRAAHENLCPHVRFTGAPPYNGALSTAPLSVHHSQVFAVPPHFSAVETMMLEPLGVAIHAADLAAPRMLETVCVLGCGPIGLLMVQLCRVAGVGHVISTDPVVARAEAARSLPARTELCAHEIAHSVDEVLELTNGRGVDLVIEATNSPGGFEAAAQVARIGGRVVLVGIPDGNAYSSLTADLMRRKALCIKLSRRMGHVMPRAIELVRHDKVDVACIATHTFALEDAPDAFAAAAQANSGVGDGCIDGIPILKPVVTVTQDTS